MNLLSLEFLQGDDLKVPITRIDLALPPLFTPEASRKIIEEHGFDAARTLRGIMFRARHQDQCESRASKVVPWSDLPRSQSLTDLSLAAEVNEK